MPTVAWFRLFLRRRWVASRVSRGGGAHCVWPSVGAGNEIFPSADSGQIQVRLRAPTGTA